MKAHLEKDMTSSSIPNPTRLLFLRDVDKVI